MSTCLPLADESDNVKQPFIDNGLDTGDYFYFGESVLDRKYRGQGIGVGFFAAREAHARSFRAYTHTTFCAVHRPDTHPARPAGFVPLDQFWKHRGYTMQPQLKCEMRWLDMGETEATGKYLIFWTKALSR